MATSRLNKYGPWALITGASDGLGLEFAKSLAAEGFSLVLVARRRQRLEEIAGQLHARYGVQVVPLDADLTAPSSVDSIASATHEFDIGLVVLAAGFGSLGEFAQSDYTSNQSMIAVNVSAVTALAQVFVPRLIARGRGALVLFGSIIGWQGTPLQSTYSATKAYVQTLAEALHVELSPHGVDVLSVAPSATHTGFADRAGMAMSKAASPDDVVQAALRGLGSKVTVVPGLRAKMQTALLRSMPRPWRSRMMLRTSRKLAAVQ